MVPLVLQNVQLNAAVDMACGVGAVFELRVILRLMR